MGYFVYILKSKKDNKRYVGMTSRPVKERVGEHNSGLVKSTKNRRPLELIYFEEFATKTEAMSREKFFKSGKGREYLKLINKLTKVCNPPKAGESDRRLNKFNPIIFNRVFLF